MLPSVVLPTRALSVFSRITSFHPLPPPSAPLAPRYYSSIGELGSAGHQDIELVLLVQHGAGRDADDYYCSGVEAVALAQAVGVDPFKTAVVAPQFMELEDSPPKGVVWWNGTAPIGYWRAGALVRGQLGGCVGITRCGCGKEGQG